MNSLNNRCIPIQGTWNSAFEDSSPAPISISSPKLSSEEPLSFAFLPVEAFFTGGLGGGGVGPSARRCPLPERRGCDDPLTASRRGTTSRSALPLRLAASASPRGDTGPGRSALLLLLLPLLLKAAVRERELLLLLLLPVRVRVISAATAAAAAASSASSSSSSSSSAAAAAAASSRLRVSSRERRRLRFLDESREGASSLGSFPLRAAGSSVSREEGWFRSRR